MLNSIVLSQLAGSGLTAGKVLHDIPHDGPAFVVYALVIAFIWMVWKGNRPKKHR